VGEGPEGAEAGVKNGVTPEQLAAFIAAHLDYGRLAAEIVLRLENPGPSPEGLVTAKELSERYGQRPRYWREHKEEFGAVPDGDGPRPRLRFDPAYVERVLAAKRL
jgi:hypothetical protein